MKHDSFIEACERAELPNAFVGPLRTHANINIGAGHGNLTWPIFQQIQAIDKATGSRLKAQVPLFVELYDAFYMGVWRHYSADGGRRCCGASAICEQTGREPSDMDSTITGLAKPKFRPSVSVVVHGGGVEISLGEHRCAFDVEGTRRAGCRV